MGGASVPTISIAGLFTRALLPAWAVLALSLLGTLAAWRYTVHLVEERARVELDSAAEDIARHIHRRMLVYEQVLHAGAALFAASSEVTRAEWRSFAAHLRIDEHFPGIQGIGFARLIPARELAAHERAVRAEGFPDYAVRPAGARDPYTSIVFLEPFGGHNLRAFGFDMYSEPVRRAAMQRAAESGDTALSGKVTLVQETGREVQAGVLLYVPVYAKVSRRDTAAERRAALVGWAYAPFRMNDFMRGQFGHAVPVVDLEIFDGGQADAATLLFSLDATRDLQRTQAAFWQRREALDIAGRRWTVVFRPQAAFAAGLDTTPRLILAGGSIVSLLLFIIAAGLATTRARAMALAARLNRDLQRSHDELERRVDERTATLQEREAHIRLLLASTGEAIYGIDMEGRCTFANPACLDLLGAAAEADLLGRDMHALIHHHHADGAPYPAEDCPIYRAFREDRGTHLDDEVLFRLDGRRFEAEYWSAPILRDGTVVGAVVTFLDISERKAAERRIAEQNLRLAEAARMKSEFLNTMSHELKTPLNAVIGFSELLAAGIPQPLPPEQRQYAQDILDAGRHLLALLTDILAYSRLDAGELKPEFAPMSLAYFLPPRLAALRALAETKRQTFAVDIDPSVAGTVQVDRDKLTRIVHNLVANAIKFTPEGGKIALRARRVAVPRGLPSVVGAEAPPTEPSTALVGAEAPPTEPSPIAPSSKGGGVFVGGASAPTNDWLEIAVTDTGIGIAAQDLPRLFQPFVQLESSLTRREGGAGLGLALARRLAELHGGDIRVESTAGHGSTFTLRLPWREDGVGAEAPPTEPTPMPPTTNGVAGFWGGDSAPT